jgi:hypothetical protein
MCTHPLEMLSRCHGFYDCSLHALHGVNNAAAWLNTSLTDHRVGAAGHCGRASDFPWPSSGVHETSAKPNKCCFLVAHHGDKKYIQRILLLHHASQLPLSTQSYV